MTCQREHNGKRREKQTTTPLLRSTSHVASACPAGAQPRDWLAECVWRRLDSATHSDGVQAAGIHTVSWRPLWWKINCCWANPSVKWRQSRSLSSLSLDSNPESTTLPVAGLIQSLRNGPFSAVRSGSSKTPIHQATMDLWVGLKSSSKSFELSVVIKQWGWRHQH